MKEVEILVKVLDKKAKVIKSLKKFKFLGVKKTLDVYFYDPLRANLSPDKSGKLNECFRIRKKNKKAFLTYKIDRFDNSNIWLYSDEYEVEISNFQTAIKIIKKLGFKNLINIENEKYTFLSNRYEIVLEDVKDLGLFLEVECLSANNKESINKTKKDIRKFIKLLDIKIGKELNVGKPELMLKYNNRIDIKKTKKYEKT